MIVHLCKGVQSLSGSVYRRHLRIYLIATERTPPQTDTNTVWYNFNLNNLKNIVANSDLDFFTAIFHIL